MRCLQDHVYDNASNYNKTFSDASPFKHIIIDDFIDPIFLEKLLTEFPSKASAAGLLSEYGGTSYKLGTTNVKEFGPNFRLWDEHIQSQEFITAMETLTGISGLLYDPDYIGGGVHENFAGRRNSIHIDYNYHPKTNYHRRFNLICYATKEWKAEYGGGIQVFEDGYKPDKGISKVSPCLYNRCIIFETTEHSWHGVESIVLPEHLKNLSRKSIALYMYTKERPAAETVDFHETIYLPGKTPSAVRSGHTLTEADAKEIRKFTQGARNLIAGLYRHLEKLLAQIKNRNAMIDGFFRNYSLPVFGITSYEFDRKQSDPSGWINGELTLRCKAVNKIENINLELRVNSSYKDKVNVYMEVKYIVFVNGEKQLIAHNHIANDQKQLIDFNQLDNVSINLNPQQQSSEVNACITVEDKTTKSLVDFSSGRAVRLLSLSIT